MAVKPPMEPAAMAEQMSPIQAVLWQWLFDSMIHLDHCIDETKQELKGFSIWKRSMEDNQLRTEGILHGRNTVLLVAVNAVAFLLVEIGKPLLLPLIQKVIG